MNSNHQRRVLIRATVNGQVCKLSFEQSFNLAHHLMMSRRDTDAARFLLALAEARPDDRPTRLLLAATDARMGRFDDCLQRLADMPGDRERLGSHLHPVLVFVSLGMWECAWKEMQDFLRSQPRWPAAWLLFGDICLKAGRQRQAAEAYEFAAKISANAPHVRDCARHCANALQRPEPN